MFIECLKRISRGWRAQHDAVEGFVMGFLREKSVMLTGSATGLSYSVTSEFGTESLKFLVGEFGERQLQAAIHCLLDSGSVARHLASQMVDQMRYGPLAEWASALLDWIAQLITNLF